MKVTFFNKTLSLILVMLTITSCKMTAQPGMSYSTSNKKAIKLYEASRTCYGQVNAATGRRNLSCAEEKAKKALEKDPSFTEAYAMLSKINIEKGRSILTNNALLITKTSIKILTNIIVFANTTPKARAL